MKEKIVDILDLNGNLTFLVGAGCSVEPPSNLPVALTMMENIIKYACYKSEQSKILKLIQERSLRFEALIEILQKTVDNNLNVINFYSECKNPNLTHFFLADMIKRGHFVLTTNFDNLIEYSLIELGIPKNEIIPVITKKDYEKYSDPIGLSKENRKPVYKVHGSTINIISGESTRDSLIATIQAFGLNKEGLSVFQIEPYKKPVFDIASNNRTLIIMGYSGSDDFDIIPSLKSLKNLKSVIWIDHNQNDNGTERVTEFFENDQRNIEDLNKVDQILVSIKRMNHAKKVYKVDINTSRLIKSLSSRKYNLKNNAPLPDLLKWLKKNIKIKDNLDYLFFSSRIYYELNLYEDGLRCAKKLLELAKLKGDKENEFIALNNIAFNLVLSERYSEGYEYLLKALASSEIMDDSETKASLLHNIAEHYRREGKDQKALEYYSLSFEMSKRLQDFRGLITVFEHISAIYIKRGEVRKAFNFMDQALKLSEQFGDLHHKAMILANYGFLQSKQKNHTKAQELIEQALVLTEKLGDPVNNAKCYLNLANIYKNKKDYYKSLELNYKALENSEYLEDITVKIVALSNIGNLHEIMRNFQQAFEFFNSAMKLIIKHKLKESEHYIPVKNNLERIKKKLKVAIANKIS